MSAWITVLIKSVWFDAMMALLSVISAALAAGLTIGLVSLNQNELLLLTINGTEMEKTYASRILPLLKDYHTLIVTLFLFNAMANEALPIFLSEFVHKYYAILIGATVTVLVFGEILPSSIFSGPNQLKIAATLCPVTTFLLILFYPIAKPIGCLLDEESTQHNTGSNLETEGSNPNLKRVTSDDYLSHTQTVQETRTEKFCIAPWKSLLSALYPRSLMSETKKNYNTYSPPPRVALHGDPRVAPEFLQYTTDFNEQSNDSEKIGNALKRSTAPRSLLDHDTVLIAQGAIICSRKCLHAIVKTSFVQTSADKVVDIPWLKDLGQHGYSRVLVRESSVSSLHYCGRSFLGYIVMKELLYDIDTVIKSNSICKAKSKSPQLKVRQLPIHPIEFFAPGHTVLYALNVMQCGNSRVGALSLDGTKNSEIIGLFTMEDIFEAIIQEDIEDEKDVKTISSSASN